MADGNFPLGGPLLKVILKGFFCVKEVTGQRISHLLFSVEVERDRESLLPVLDKLWKLFAIVEKIRDLHVQEDSPQCRAALAFLSSPGT